MEEFKRSHHVTWNDDTLWCGLDDNMYQQVPAAATACSLVQYIEYVLWLSGSSLTVDEVAGDNTTTQQQSSFLLSRLQPVMIAIPESRPKMAATSEPLPKMVPCLYPWVF